MLLSKKTIQYINQFGCVALAVSGGRDSMVLLNEFLSNQDKLCPFVVVNVHHNLRGQEGIDDSNFVRDFCIEHNIKLFMFDEDIPAFCQKHGYTIEQGARIRRREIFIELVKSGQVERVVTAHHADDQAESILMHIFRGSGVNGLKGMALDDGVLLRPMLDIGVDKIKEYCEQLGIGYVEDSTNSQNDYARNKLRNIVMPTIQSIYGGARDNINKLSSIATDMSTLIDELCTNVTLVNDKAYIPCEMLNKNNLIVAEMIAKALDLIHSRVDLTTKHIQAVKDLYNAQGGKMLNLPNGIVVYKQNQDIVFGKTQPNTQFVNNIDQYPTIFGQVQVGVVDCGDSIVEISQSDNGGLRCDGDKLKGAVIRTRTKGDKIRKFGGGSKSLGDYLTDLKIDKSKRNNIVVVAVDNQILAIPSIDISQDITITSQTTNIWYIKLTTNK